MLEHMIQKKFGPSSMIFVCKHDVSYPDICIICIEEKRILNQRQDWLENR